MNRREKEEVEREKIRLIRNMKDVYMYAAIVTLREEFGFGRDRTERFIARHLREIYTINSGMVDFENYKTAALESVKMVEEFDDE